MNAIHNLTIFEMCEALRNMRTDFLDQIGLYMDEHPEIFDHDGYKMLTRFYTINDFFDMHEEIEMMTADMCSLFENLAAEERINSGD